MGGYHFDPVMSEPGRVAHTSSPSSFFSEERPWEDSTSIILRGALRGVPHSCAFCKGGERMTFLPL